DEKFVWNEEEEKSFEELKQRLVSAPVLTLSSGSSGFQIYSDASKKGLGCASLRVEPDLISRIKEAQKADSEIWTIVENLAEQTEFRLDEDDVLWQDTRLCVPNDATLRE
nr:transposon Ty3-G Gag-Pol polyprotein [Tanacetum cinerariifolium]